MKKLLAKITLAISIINLVTIPAISYPISNPKNIDKFNDEVPENRINVKKKEVKSFEF